MRTKWQMMARLIVPVLACLAVCLPLASWMLSACGYPCHSLLADEGLRWLFLHMDHMIATPLTAYALVYASTAGALQICVRIHQHSANHASLWVAIVVALTMCLLPMLTFILPDSPLRAITGGIWPSPLLSGLPLIIPIALLAASVLYAYLNLYLTSASRFCLILTWGLRRHGLWIVAAMLLSFVHGTLHYVL